MASFRIFCFSHIGHAIQPFIAFRTPTAREGTSLISLSNLGLLRAILRSRRNRQVSQEMRLIRRLFARNLAFLERPATGLKACTAGLLLPLLQVRHLRKLFSGSRTITQPLYPILRSKPCRHSLSFTVSIPFGQRDPNHYAQHPFGPRISRFASCLAKITSYTEGMKLALFFACLVLSINSWAETKTLTLRQALDLALAQNPDIVLARLDQQKSRAQVALSQDLFRPKMSAGTGAAYTSGYPTSIDGNPPAIVQGRLGMAIFNRPQSYLVAHLGHKITEPEAEILFRLFRLHRLQ